MVGSAFSHVAYLEPATTDLTEPRTGEGFDEAGVGLEFTTSDGAVFSAVWQMEGYNEGLSFGPGDGESRHRRYALRRFDVTRSAQWQPLLGPRVTGVGVGWHVPNEGCAEAVWAVRLDLEGGRTVLVALGRSEGTGVLDYQPDEVVVVFDEELAESYRIPAQTKSAWAT